jgi:hypothetical protein
MLWGMYEREWNIRRVLLASVWCPAVSALFAALTTWLLAIAYLGIAGGSGDYIPGQTLLTPADIIIIPFDNFSTVMESVWIAGGLGILLMILLGVPASWLLSRRGIDSKWLHAALSTVAAGVILYAIPDVVYEYILSAPPESVALMWQGNFVDIYFFVALTLVANGLFAHRFVYGVHIKG